MPELILKTKAKVNLWQLAAACTHDELIELRALTHTSQFNNLIKRKQADAASKTTAKQ